MNKLVGGQCTDMNCTRIRVKGSFLRLLRIRAFETHGLICDPMKMVFNAIFIVAKTSKNGLRTLLKDMHAEVPTLDLRIIVGSCSAILIIAWESRVLGRICDFLE